MIADPTNAPAVAHHGGRRLINRALQSAALGAAVLLLIPGRTPLLSAFEIGGCGAVIGMNEPHCGLPVHEGITEDAIRSITPGADQNFINNVNHGVQNTDLTHHFQAPFHFDNSSAQNGGFDAGFQNVDSLLRIALREATLCDPSCRRNPQFLSPIHGTFTGIADDIVATITAIASDGACIAEPACSSIGLAASAAAITADVAPTRVNASLDPDNPGYFQPLGDVKAKVNGALGRHCDLMGSRCFDNLEDMLTGSTSFQNKAQHLRVLQHELLAYFAWQHVGHAFHAVQDFFAHSNYVELAAGKDGPPCSPALFKPVICDTEITGLDPAALPIPAAAASGGVSSFVAAFSAAGLRQTLGSRSVRLESGYYDTPQKSICTAPAGFHYCHYSTSTAIGLNKDTPFTSGDVNPSHKNHAFARNAATRASAQLWAAFLHDLPPDRVVAAGSFHPAAPIVAPLRELDLELVDGPVSARTQKATLVVTARDRQTHAVVKGTVIVLGSNGVTQVSGATGSTIAFTPCREFDPALKRYVGEGACTVRVTATGYATATTTVTR